ncbi:MAG: phosphoadenylyl-sulfate reductase [Sandaracinaceae bacterium]
MKSGMREALRLVPPASPTGEPLDVDAINQELEGAPAEHVIRWARETFGAGLILSSSFGAESAMMLHLVTRIVPDIPVVFLDTGYLFPETYTFAEELTQRFKLNLKVYGPRMTAARQEALYGRMWEGSEEDLARYQQINKIEPMDRALRELGATAWIAGLRRQQTEFRKGLRVVEPQDGVFKIHPILDWNRDDVRRYMIAHDLPYHPLYAYGYRSIGDWHSTTPTTVDQDERDGRHLGVKRECGIHLPRTPEANASLKSSGL